MLRKVSDGAATVDSSEIAAAVAAVLTIPNESQIRNACVAAIGISCTGPDGSIYTTAKGRADAAIAEACTGPFGSIHALLASDLMPEITGTLTGATSYVLFAGLPGAQWKLKGIVITSENKGVTVQIKDGTAVPYTAVHTIYPGVPLVIGPGTHNLFAANTEESVVLHVSDSSAQLNVTFWREYA